MFKEVSLAVRSRNDLAGAARANAVDLSIADCQPLDRERMVMLLDLEGSPAAVEETVAALRRMDRVEHAHAMESDTPGSRVLVTMKKPGVCRASAGDALMCVDCPFNSTEVPALWRFVARQTTDIGRIVARLVDEGIQTRIEGIAPLDGRAPLTDEEKKTIMVAIEKGYFDFPRKVTLEGLSQALGVEMAALSKIIGRLE